MKAKEEIKDDVAKEYGYDDWRDVILSGNSYKIEMLFDIVIDRVHDECKDERKRTAIDFCDYILVEHLQPQKTDFFSDKTVIDYYWNEYQKRIK